MPSLITADVNDLALLVRLALRAPLSIPALLPSMSGRNWVETEWLMSTVLWAMQPDERRRELINPPSAHRRCKRTLHSLPFLCLSTGRCGSVVTVSDNLKLSSGLGRFCGNTFPRIPRHGLAAADPISLLSPSSTFWSLHSTRVPLGCGSCLSNLPSWSLQPLLLSQRGPREAGYVPAYPLPCSWLTGVQDTHLPCGGDLEVVRIKKLIRRPLSSHLTALHSSTLTASRPGKSMCSWTSHAEHSVRRPKSHYMLAAS